MLITRTPFRISFFGGGTDFPSYYQENEGAVLSTTINKYCYITCRYLPPFFDHSYRIRYLKREETSNIDDIQHPVVRECLKYMNLPEGIEMVHTSDIPARSGIGSSSSFTVGFLHALYALQGKMATKRQLADEAIYMEQHILKENVGSQDQIAAAFGGLNKISFSNGKYFVDSVRMEENKLNLLQQSLMLYFTGYARTSSEIVEEQMKRTSSNQNNHYLNDMYLMVDEAIHILNSPNRSLFEFGKLLHESWLLKKNLASNITNNFIDEMYETALKAGAIGGKILGAGGGGFMLLYVPIENQPNVKKVMKNYLHVPFKFENLGSHVPFYSTQEKYLSN